LLLCDRTGGEDEVVEDNDTGFRRFEIKQRDVSTADLPVVDRSNHKGVMYTRNTALRPSVTARASTVCGCIWQEADLSGDMEAVLGHSVCRLPVDHTFLAVCLGLRSVFSRVVLCSLMAGLRCAASFADIFHLVHTVDVESKGRRTDNNLLTVSILIVHPLFSRMSAAIFADRSVCGSCTVSNSSRATSRPGDLFVTELQARIPSASARPPHQTPSSR
jgi:hypothetical protein